MNLVVFFSRGVSLQVWHRAGILERELAVYRGLAPTLDRVAFVTYGGVDDRAYVTEFPKLDVLPNSWRLPGNVYSVLAPLIHRRYLGGASAFRTNQINGSWAAVLARVLFRKPLIVRCGFLWTDNLARETSSGLRRAASRALERLAFRSADRIVVASDHQAVEVSERYAIPRDKVTVIANYVDTTIFRTQPGAREKGRVLFVGRLEPEKNLHALIDAVAGIPDAKLTIVGDGSVRGELERRAGEAGIDGHFTGRLPHRELPALMSRAEVFVLPSKYEGHPKALLEAMACGCAVIGTTVPGIQEVIQDETTGLLCATTVEAIRAALTRLLSDLELRQRLSAAAVAYVTNQCSLSVAIQRERELLTSLAR